MDSMDIMEEERVMNEFRNRVKDLQQTDSTLRRFLKARNNNVQNAEVMLRKSIQWRKDNDIDNALTWKVNEEHYQKYRFEYSGVNHQNEAVLYGSFGIHPTRELVEAGQKDEAQRILYVCIEEAIANIIKTGGEQCMFIADLAELSYWKIAHYQTIQFVISNFRMFEANYPERLGSVYIINAPSFFSYFWSILKPFVPGQTLPKVSVFGKDENTYMSVLSEKIPASSMPPKLRKLLK